MRNVLFYGGCHAHALKRIFDEYSTEDGLQCDVLTNFVLIGAGTPFPYEKLSGYDTVIFSPIMNKGNYNTSILLDFCRDNSVRTVSYPWLQWNGYFPFIRKGPILSVVEWHHGAVGEIGALSDVKALRARMAESFADRSRVLDNLARTTETLRNHEVSNQCDIRISEFVMDT